MRPITLFGGQPVPTPIRTAPFVAGVDRVQAQDLPQLVKFQHEALLLQALSETRGSIFYGRWRPRGWQ